MGLRVAWQGVAVAVLLAGCAAAGPPAGQGATEYSGGGSFRLAGLFALCNGMTCDVDAPQATTVGNFTLPANATHGVLTATWQAGPSTPARWYVRVTRQGGGTWGFANGTSPLRVGLVAPLPRGAYQVDGWPAMAYAGPLDGTVQWHVNATL